jgi:hypothetical protein
MRMKERQFTRATLTKKIPATFQLASMGNIMVFLQQPAKQPALFF